MENIFRITIGDWSCDGHNQFEVFNFKCNKEEKDIHKAYLKAVELSGIKLNNDHKNKKNCKLVLSEYEEGSISEEQVEKLLAIGVRKNKLKNIDWCDNECGVAPEGLVELFLEMVYSQMNDFEYKFINFKSININSLGGMGYGLYS